MAQEVPRKSAKDLAVEGDESSVGRAGVSDRRRFLAGEISRAEYLELQVDRALGALGVPLSPEQYADLRQVMSEELDSDPVLLELTNQALSPE